MKADGLPALLSALRPDPRPERSATIGELINEAKAVATCRASTLNQYEVSMRRLVAGVLGMEATPETFYHRSEAAKQWRAKVEGASLDVLSAERVERWRKTYVAAAPDEIARAASKNSAASIIRNARALLAPAMIEAMKGKLRIPTPPPLSTLAIGGAVRRFKTSVKPRDMFDAAKAQLLGDPLAALVLCLFGGLRRGEVDMLPWSHVDLENGFVEVRTTPHFRPKTVESERVTPLPTEALKILRKHRAAAPRAEMVLTGLDPAVSRPVTKTRCKCWGPLRAWLRTQGFKTPNPIHELRKLSGSMINAAVGLEAARRHLGHRSIATTAGSYVTGSAAVIDLDAK
jgi:integrase